MKLTSATLRCAAWSLLALITPQLTQAGEVNLGPLTPPAIARRLEIEFNPDALARAAQDLAKTDPDRCPWTPQSQAKLEAYRLALPKIHADLVGKNPPAAALRDAQEMLAFSRQLLLANPLLDFDRILLIHRQKVGGARAGDLGYTTLNSHTPITTPRKAWENEIGVLSQIRNSPKYTPLYKPETGRLLRDLQLDFDARHIAFSSRGSQGTWSIQELQADGSGLRQLTPNEQYPEIDFFGPCYLPDGKMLMSSNASYQGLPCEGGGQPIANLYQLNPQTRAIRQLAFDQDSDSYPSVLSDGRVMFLRWEYSDLSHYFSRRIMSMNPDGTGQVALYGSNSQFPTTFLFPRAIPGHPSKIVGLLGGHHDWAECGRGAILDPALASSYPYRFHPQTKEWGKEGVYIATTPEVLPAERTGFVQTLPGYGKPVVANVCDSPVSRMFAHEPGLLMGPTHPLSEHYFLAAAQPPGNGLWGLYLIDCFDNATLLAQADGDALLEPVPFQAVKRPPILPDRVNLQSTQADVHIADIYNGPGLAGVPRGSVKKIRVFAYHFAYNRRGGHDSVGTESSWDVKRILGEARVEEDGSSFFQIPANTPISLQPLDSEGRAVQLMRSWVVGMPGEHISCIGCHEDRRSVVPPRQLLADRKPAQPLEVPPGGVRPFAFTYEVFPLLEKYCLSCHSENPTVGPRSKPSFKDPAQAYRTLHPYIHRPGPESDPALLVPMEYHASTSRLIQMLEAGHHGLRLADIDMPSRQQLYRWIDLNVPFKGSWDLEVKGVKAQCARRQELSTQFANLTANPEAEYAQAMADFQKRPVPAPVKPAADAVERDTLVAPQAPAATHETRELDLGQGQSLKLIKIPAGTFVMGSLDGAPDERPRRLVTIQKPFWMSITEVTNGQYAQWDPAHDTRYHGMHGKDHSVPGYIANHPNQPVARISWQEARAFCQWLSAKTHEHAELPTEAQWEWAARAGTQTAYYYGTLESDYTDFANLADQGLRWTSMGFDGPGALQVRHPYSPDANFPLHDERFNDKSLVVDYVAQRKPNPWGLYDMIGNVSEWTLSSYSHDGVSETRKVARGGSWADRPADAGSTIRRAYESWQKVHDVGFRVILEIP